MTDSIKNVIFTTQIVKEVTATITRSNVTCTLDGKIIAEGYRFVAIKDHPLPQVAARLGKVFVTHEVWSRINDAQKDVDTHYRVNPVLPTFAIAQDILTDAHATIRCFGKLAKDSADAKKMWKAYNNFQNEGGDGYVPPIVTQLSYDRAIHVVSTSLR